MPNDVSIVGNTGMSYMYMWDECSSLDRLICTKGKGAECGKRQNKEYETSSNVDDGTNSERSNNNNVSQCLR